MVPLAAETALLPQVLASASGSAPAVAGAGGRSGIPCTIGSRTPYNEVQGLWLSLGQVETRLDSMFAGGRAEEQGCAPEYVRVIFPA